jgi:hypothetical protein
MSTALANRESLPLTVYQAQGIGHILKLSGIVTAGTLLVSAGGSLLFAAPLALATVYQLFRTSGKVKDPDWCESRDELFTYRLSPKHPNIADSYPTWCEEWGARTINALIEPMIGNLTLCNFTQNKKHPYHGLRGVLVYSDGELMPLTPHDYLIYRLGERMEALQPKEAPAVDVPATEVKTEEEEPITFVLEEKPAATNSAATITDEKQAIAMLLNLTTAPLQPVIIAGLPGSGKGFLAAIALALGAKQHGLKYWVFNPKANLAEAGYWARAERHYLKNRLQKDDALFTDLTNVLERFGKEASDRNNHPGEHQPFVLLLEELNAIVGLFTAKQKQEFKARIVGLISLLRGCNMAIWVSGQSVNLDDLGLTGKSNRAIFTGIVAVDGTKADGLEALCKPLEIPLTSVPTGDRRYWLTATTVYQSPVIKCPVPTYSSWSVVPNLIDLRPSEQAGEAAQIFSMDGASFEPNYPREEAATQSAVPDNPEQETAISLINEISNPEHKEALLIAYNWATNRSQKGEELTRESFRKRASAERKSTYLREHWGEIWTQLEALL